MKQFLVTAILIAGGMFAPLLLVEVGFRVYALSQSQSLHEALQASEQSGIPIDNPSLKGLVKQSEDARLVYDLKPNVSGKFLNQPLRINSFGMRYPEIPTQKDPATVRIALIGDSIAFGWGIKEEERYSSLLEQTLSQKFSRKVEVLNFGVPGYNSAIEAGVVEQKASLFQPDILILHFVNNDDSAPYFLSSSDSPWSLRKSFLKEFIVQRLAVKRKAHAETSAVVGFGGLPQETKNAVMKEYAWMVGFSAVQNSLERIGRWGKEHHVPVYIVFGTLRKGQFSILRRVAKKYDISLIGVKNEVEKYFSEKHIVRPDDRMKALTLNAKDPHPNAIGHSLYAKALTDAITIP